MGSYLKAYTLSIVVWKTQSTIKKSYWLFFKPNSSFNLWQVEITFQTEMCCIGRYLNTHLRFVTFVTAYLILSYFWNKTI